MIRQQKIEKIRRACIASNPSILDLKFGCEVIIRGGFRRTVWQILFNDDDDCDRISHVITESSSIGMVQVSPIESLERIIGRELQLSDILLAIEQKTRKINFFYSYDLPGHFCIGDHKDAYRWNLLKPFEEQSDEVIEFISGLI